MTSPQAAVSPPLTSRKKYKVNTINSGSFAFYLPVRDAAGNERNVLSSRIFAALRENNPSGAKAFDKNVVRLYREEEAAAVEDDDGVTAPKPVARAQIFESAERYALSPFVLSRLSLPPSFSCQSAPPRHSR